ncbi:hypothetical protein OAM52_04940 [Flavobacteriaceae bacterium]|nr:hypothetical protein [Flavobacteriaceae bacterium]
MSTRVCFINFTNTENYWIDNWNNPKVIKLAEIGHFPQEEKPNKVIEELRIE